jgi:hypothetical protein
MSPLGYPTKILTNLLFTSWPVENLGDPLAGWLGNHLEVYTGLNNDNKFDPP